MGFLTDISKGIGSIVGTATGVVAGLSLQLVAATLGITTAMVKQAMDSGCKTVEEIQNFWNSKQG